MKLLVACLAALAAAEALPLHSPAWAQQAAAVSIAICASTSDSLARLECYDKLFPPGVHPPAVGQVTIPDVVAPVASVAATADGAPAPAPTSNDYAPWQVTVTKSDIDDSPKILAFLRSSDDTGFSVDPKAISLRCIEHKTSVIVSTNNFSAGIDTGQVTTRFDDAPATTTGWDMASDDRSVGLWDGTTAIPFLRSLRGAKKLAIRVMTNGQSDLVFDDLGNVSGIVDRLAQACGWPAVKAPPATTKANK